MKTCKTTTDINGNEICAGDKDGGHDACQGDLNKYILSNFKLSVKKY